MDADTQLTLTAGEVVARIEADARRRGYPWVSPTVDRIVWGDSDSLVTGIATTWMATMPALESAASHGCNLVMSHEPTFWHHLDEIPTGAESALYESKTAWLRARGMTVMRFHDHHHSMFDADPVMEALIDDLAWRDRTVGTSFASQIDVGTMTVRDLASHVADSVGEEAVRTVGDPDAPVSTVGFGDHSLAGCLDAIRVNDVVLTGEIREWDAYEYFRDAQTLGIPRNLVVTSHRALENPASGPLATWLSALLPEVPVISVDVPPPFEVHLVGS
ncbi:putative NIF3 family GTP cyclohydrolase 1 type 2 [Microbacterium terrae]|uniref:GTP cyclohydrolase 1 type 2 homolog n=1 Tax=Microbacterium terrae TaxID=69369 RepID=A0A0M2H0H7_9MICO|nr:Nif3-like dinuclear metal center hexameric protein [Microbacterium terrae]KJL37515.1 NIF3 (NGG1p interacting factor 3) [Microbacterium terrae]MBP1076344.1 putative NIF3 family GTP cyclohydrolase 1 type 2 [Microbacterium terrae]GLJ97168.1 hypothetical protein GCM10017594_03650 [Microbacterium terrae]